MGGLKRLRNAILTIMVAVGLVGAFSIPMHAEDGKDDKDDRDKKAAATKTAPAKADPAGLTERERMLLERVEELEKRVAELEAKGGPAVAASASATASRTASATAVSAALPATPEPKAAPVASAVVPAVSASVIPAAPTAAGVTTTSPVDSNVIPDDKVVAALAPQAQGTGAASYATKTPASEPFAFADFTWLNGNARTKESPMDTKFFTPEIRADVDYIYDFNHPKDDSIGGSSEVFRAQEVQLTQLGVGGDFHFDNVRARVMTQFGMYSETTPRNDASPARGQWNLDTAYRYISEAYGGYHFNVLHGINIDAGIFMSYIGLFSYYNFDNWAYQPSFVSSNTPWFFNGVRVQIFPTEHLKIEPWFTNGWQSYGRFNNRPGLGMQILYRPNGWFSVLGNEYALGAETLGNPNRIRYHSDDSIEIKYYDRPGELVDKMAFSLTGDIGCEHGGGVSCDTNSKKGPKQDFLGFMLYDRTWFHNDKFGLTLGGGRINNPGRYLVLLPPINGATAATGTPYFTENPGDPFKAWDASGTFDYMPSQYITFRWEFDHRAANMPYWTGAGGITPPGGNNGSPASFACLDGSVALGGACGAAGLWLPDLKKIENRIDLAILVKF
jgi:hypothetical protein